MNLRPYQQHAVENAIATFERAGSGLIVMATGCGKTVVFSSLIKNWPNNDRVLVVAHREELIHQAADKIARITGEQPDIEMADMRADTGSMWSQRARVVVASVQSLIAGKPARMERFNPRTFGLVIIDEAHHAPASSYGKVLEFFGRNAGIKIVGVTATPDRADEQALGRVFQEVICEYNLLDAIRDGYLVPIHQTSVNVHGLDYSNVGMVAGDLNQRGIAKAQSSEAVLHEMVHPTIEIANGRKTIVFATPGSGGDENDEFKISERMTEIFNRWKPGCAARVHQGTPKDQRKQILNDFTTGRTQFLVNVGVLTEGFDEPSIECVALMRPTKSRSLFAQMVGRGTRPLPNVIDNMDTPEARRWAIGQSAKPKVEIIDFKGNAGRHKLVHTADILAGDREEKIVQRAKEIAEKDGGDVAEIMEKIEADEIAENERKLVLAKAKYSIENLDPFDVLALRHIAVRGWDKSPTNEQVAALERLGVPVSSQLTKTQAAAIIIKMKERRREGLPGYRETARLKSMGQSPDLPLGKALNALFNKKVGV